MPEESAAFLRRELAEYCGDALPELRDGPLGGFAQKGLELRERQLDGIEIGRVRRQIDQVGASALDEFAHARDLVSRQVVHDDGVAVGQGGKQHLLDVDKEGLTVHRPVEQEGGDQSAAAKPGGKGRGLPVSPGDGRDQALAAQASTALAHHLGIGAGFVDEDQPVDVEMGLPGPPLVAGLSDVGPGLFAGVQTFF